MTVAIPKAPPMPDIEHPVVDPQTGKMNIEWYKFFSRYERIWRALILAAGGTP